MRLVILYFLFIILLSQKTCETNGDESYENYRIDNLYQMDDWDCWYKDYFLKVEHCPSTTLKSNATIQCRNFRGCKRYCKSVYGMQQCRVRCNEKESNISRYIKVIYATKSKETCKDSVICVYKTQCQSMWPTHILDKCYYSYDFYKWWINHKKEYITPKISKKFSMKTNKQMYYCKNNNGNSCPIDVNLETTIKMRMGRGKMFYQIGDLWIPVKTKKEKLFYRIGKLWIPVKFTNKHQYFQIGGKWLRTVASKKELFCQINNLWMPLKISFGKEYIKLGERWLRLKVIGDKYLCKFGVQWLEVKILDNDLYSKIEENWYKVQIKRYSSMIKLGGIFRKIKLIDNKKYIKLGSRWFELEMKTKKYKIKLDTKWYELIFENKNIFIKLNDNSYNIIFDSFNILIQVLDNWYEMEALNENLFFRIDKLWLNFILRKNNFHINKNGKSIEIIIDKNKNLFYKTKAGDVLKLIPDEQMENGSYFTTDNFYKFENPIKLKLIGGQWLPYKNVDGKSLFLLSQKLIEFKVKNQKLFYKNHKKWIEICLIGNAEFNKINNHWLEIKREKEKKFFYDYNRWQEFKLEEQKIYLQINNKWKMLAFFNGQKFIRIGQKFMAFKFHKKNTSKFHLKMGGKWFNLMIQFDQFYIQLDSLWKRIEFYSHRPVQILFQKTWVSVAFKNHRLYLKNGNCWLETLLENEKIFLKLGDTFIEAQLSTNRNIHLNINGKFYKLIERNTIEFHRRKIKITYVDEKLQMDVNDNWLPVKIEKETLFVKVMDSWIESYIHKNGKIISAIINKQKIHLTFENGILCEQLGKIKIPISIRFGKLYYNLDDKWVKIQVNGNFRYSNINNKLILLNEKILIEKIKKYKSKLMLKCMYWLKKSNNSFATGDNYRNFESKKMKNYRLENQKAFDTNFMHRNSIKNHKHIAEKDERNQKEKDWRNRKYTKDNIVLR